LNGHREPFFTTVFTISTHPPYTLPEAWADVFPEGELEMHRTIRYTDRMLQQFFEAARKEPWFERTLFVITGDHTQSSRSLHYDTMLGRYMVPLLLYHPGMKLPVVDPERITQQVDLLPTILDVVGVDAPGPLPLFGRSVFSPVPGEAILQSNGTYWLVRKEGVLQYDPDGEERIFAFQRHETVPVEVERPAEIRGELSMHLRAHLQHFSNSLITNSFYQSRGVAGGAPPPGFRSPGGVLTEGGGSRTAGSPRR
jgi:arylsulfatase A-like enzyme